MSQTFKTIYLAGHPASDAKRKHIRLAFGPKEATLYEAVKGMTSEEIRQLLNVSDFDELKSFSDDHALSINRACISLLHQVLLGRTESGYTAETKQWNVNDPLIATYRGGRDDTFHDWYPLIEGFTSRFVETVLDTYAPNANLVLDPFGGCGSTPLTVAMQGCTGYYCELNPAFQLVTYVKAQALQVDYRRRQRLVESLREEAFGVPFKLGMVKSDIRLEKNYYRAFGKSRFFNDETFQDVLRLRTLADELEAKWPLLGQLFTVAVLASLVPSSLMKRAGDLRYKTEHEMRRGQIAIREDVSRRLSNMARDLESADVMSGHTTQILDDARALGGLPGLNVDAVITSPPYLNGTNYFRNTKVELWFLRAVNSPEDLARFRWRSITAGINDVTKAKDNRAVTAEAAEVVEGLFRVAYDPRIPLMVARYFGDMEDVLRGVTRHVAAGGILAIDIGDSRYCGLHIETDSILASIGRRLGFREVASHNLRVRKSRDAGILRQVLLVMEWQGITKASTGVDSQQIETRQWSIFKERLPHQKQPFSKRNWGHPLHSLCSYQGKMKPSLAHFLVKAFVPEGGTTLDPFAGVGTIPFEACLQGKRAYGFDISPAAITITAAKVGKPNADLVRNIIEQLDDYLRTHKVSAEARRAATEIRFNRALEEFYEERTFSEILVARDFFKDRQTTDASEAMVMACILHILHGNRPYALSRRSHPITPFAPTGEFEYKPLVAKLREKVERSVSVQYPEGFVCGSAYMQDATSWWPREVENIDTIITSPPFFDSTRFYLANWIRLWFCGWEKDDFTSEPLRFVDSRQKETMHVYEAVFRQAKERLKADGIFVLHVGKSSKCDMARELGAVARPWFHVIDQFEESVAHTESHGVTDKGEVTVHQYLVLR